MLKFLRPLGSLSLFFLSQQVNAQGSGVIIRPAGLVASQTILDPGAPAGYTSKTTAGFLGDDVTNSKTAFKPIPSFSAEPFGDLRRGPNHLYSDFVPDANGSGVYVTFDGTNFLFRMRLGSVVPGAKGYSILIDADNKFGASGATADPNYVAATTGVNGNPGFEIEVDLFTQNTSNPGVAIYDVDGTSNPTLKKSYNNWLNYSQLSIAGTNDNGDPDFFLDFYVPLADLTTYFGIDANTPLRMNATTVMAPSPAIGGPKSDIYGLNDSDYKNTNSQWEAYINAQPTFKLSTLNNTGTAPIGAICTAPPVVTTATAAVSTAQVQGTWARSALPGAIATATVSIYINGSTTAAGSTSVTSGGTWTVSGLTVATGDLITAKAQAAGESLCLVSNTFRVTNCASPSSRPVTPLLSCGPAIAKGMTGTNKSTGWTVWVANATRNTTDNSVTNTGAIFDPETGVTPNISWMYSSGCTGGSNMTSGSYRVWYTDANGCQSDPVITCQSGNGGSALGSSTALIAPVIISPTAFTVATKAVSGTASAGSTVNLYVNGILTASTITTGTISTVTTGTFTITGLNINENDVISLTCEFNTGTVGTSYCGSKGTTTYTVGCYTTPPVITTNATTGQLTIGQPITGTSPEPASTIIKVYNSGNALLGTTTVQADGSWTTAGAVFSNGFTGVATASTTYYATATKSVCNSVASANTTTASGPTSARCGTITTSPIAYTTTAISGTLIGTTAAGTVVNLYEDGYLIGSFTTATNSWGPIDVANKLYSGDGTTTGKLTIGVQELGKEEISCPASATVTCSGPLTPSYTQQSSNGSTGSGATVPTGGTMTYTITNLSPITFYSIADAVTGKTYAGGTWTSSSTLPGDYITITTNALTASGSYNGVLKATLVSSANMCSSLATNSSFTVLPVALLEFKAVRNNTANLLAWKTGSEINLSRFEIEKSSDGRNYEKIGQVLATGAGTYEFTDNNLANTANYYRLRMVDNDGKSNYSKVILLKQDNAISISSIRPNPFVNEVALQLMLTKSEAVNILLIDEKGRQVASKRVAALPGLTTVTLSNLQHLSSGVYLLQVVAGDKMLPQKLLKL
jgi:hypothetical protein